MSPKSRTRKASEAFPQSQGEVAQKKPRAEHDLECNFKEVITVLVGINDEAAVVHKHAICGQSDFFKALCNGRWKESNEGLVRLRDLSPSMFNEYLCWLYSSGTLDLEHLLVSYYKHIIYCDESASTKNRHSIDQLAAARPSKQKYYRSRALARFWTMTDFLADVSLKNKIMDVFSAPDMKAELGLDCSDAVYIWEKTIESYTLNLWMLEHVRAEFTSENILALHDIAPPALVGALLKGFVLHRDTRPAFKPKKQTAVDRCKYHEHAEGSDICVG